MYLFFFIFPRHFCTNKGFRHSFQEWFVSFHMQKECRRNWGKNYWVKAFFITEILIPENKQFQQNCDFRHFGKRFDFGHVGSIFGVLTSLTTYILGRSVGRSVCLPKEIFKQNFQTKFPKETCFFYFFRVFELLKNILFFHISVLKLNKH